MFSHLLLPLDGSPIAAQAIPYATTLARALGSHITLLSVIEPAPDWSGMPRATAKEADERARALASAYLGTVADHLSGEGLTVSTDVRLGNAAVTLLAAAEEDNCSLIVMATHGRSGINRLRLGSVAQHTVRHAPIPALIVRADERAPSEGAAAVSTITVTLDGSAVAEQVLPTAATLADALRVPLNLLEVLPNYYFASYAWPGMVYAPSPEQAQEEEEAVAAYLEETAKTLHTPGREVHTAWQRSVTNRADPVIIDYLAARPTGIAVMASHGRDGVARWVLGSTAEAVIAQPPCAVLVVRARMSEQGENTRAENNAGKEVVTRQYVAARP
jgi:nucleotide-binding universal stress UspA family protein